MVLPPFWVQATGSQSTTARAPHLEMVPLIVDSLVTPD